MIPHDTVINALRELGFTFKKQTDRVVIYKKRGGTNRVAVRRRDFHDRKAIGVLLAQAGMPHDEIERFLDQVNR